jgi:hypothetical protein
MKLKAGGKMVLIAAVVGVIGYGLNLGITHGYFNGGHGTATQTIEAINDVWLFTLTPRLFDRAIEIHVRVDDIPLRTGYDHFRQNGFAEFDISQRYTSHKFGK